METEYQKTLHFCDANAQERKEIYENIGYKRVSVLHGTGEKVMKKKNVGIDAVAMNERSFMIGISEKICRYPYANMLDKKFSVELYSDFEEGTSGWARTTSANTVFYFFIDAIVSVDLKTLRMYLDDFDGGTAEEYISDLAAALIEHNVAGKRLEGKDDVEVYVESNGNGHHSVGLVFHPNRELAEEFDYLEYYFEDVPDEEGTDDEEEEE